VLYPAISRLLSGSTPQSSWTVRSVDLVEIYLALTLHRAIHRGGRIVRPGLLELAAILRSSTSQESTWVFLFGPTLPTLIYFHPRPAPVRHTYMCARSQGNGDFDTSTTSLSLIFNQPLLSSLFTSVSLHTTFLLIKQKNRLPSDRSISAPYISHQPRHRRPPFDPSIVQSLRPCHVYNGHDIAATGGFRQ